MVITRHGQHTAQRRGARHVAVFEHIRRTVNARAFAVPNPKHPIVQLLGLWRKGQLLGAPNGGRCQLLVDPRLKHNVLRI